MDPITAGLITGGASLIGSIFSSDTSAQNTAAQLSAQQAMLNQTEKFNASQTQQAEQFSASQAQAARDYNTQMSNTAYQRASADMKEAGLNPMMMFGSGGPASVPSSPSPSGQAASVGTPTVPMPQTRSALGDLGEMASKVVNTAVSAKSFDRMTQEIANLQAEQALTAAKRRTEEERPGVVSAEARLIRNKADLAALDIPAGQVSAREASLIANSPSWLFNPATYGDYYSRKFGSVSDAVGSLVSNVSGVGKILKSLQGAARSGNAPVGRPFRDFNSPKGDMQDFLFNYGE